MSKRSAEYQAVARKDITYRQWVLKEMKRNKVAYVMIAPYVLVFTLFTVVPVFLSVIISFTNFTPLKNVQRLQALVMPTPVICNTSRCEVKKQYLKFLLNTSLNISTFHKKH